MEEHLYHYRATLVRVIDGDTVVLDLDLGFHIRQQHTFRLAAIDAPEPRGASRAEGILAREFLTSLLASASEITAWTQRDRSDSFGRYIVTLYGDGIDLNQVMVEQGYAVPYP